MSSKKINVIIDGKATPIYEDLLEDFLPEIEAVEFDGRLVSPREYVQAIIPRHNLGEGVLAHAIKGVTDIPRAAANLVEGGINLGHRSDGLDPEEMPSMLYRPGYVPQERVRTQDDKKVDFGTDEFFDNTLYKNKYYNAEGLKPQKPETGAETLAWNASEWAAPTGLLKLLGSGANAAVKGGKGVLNLFKGKSTTSALDNAIKSAAKKNIAARAKDIGKKAWDSDVTDSALMGGLSGGLQVGGIDPTISDVTVGLGFPKIHGVSNSAIKNARLKKEIKVADEIAKASGLEKEAMRRRLLGGSTPTYDALDDVALKQLHLGLNPSFEPEVMQRLLQKEKKLSHVKKEDVGEQILKDIDQNHYGIDTSNFIEARDNYSKVVDPFNFDFTNKNFLADIQDPKIADILLQNKSATKSMRTNRDLIDSLQHRANISGGYPEGSQDTISELLKANNHILETYKNKTPEQFAEIRKELASLIEKEKNNNINYARLVDLDSKLREQARTQNPAYKHAEKKYEERMNELGELKGKVGKLLDKSQPSEAFDYLLTKPIETRKSIFDQYLLPETKMGVQSLAEKEMLSNPTKALDYFNTNQDLLQNTRLFNPSDLNDLKLIDETKKVPVRKSTKELIDSYNGDNNFSVSGIFDKLSKLQKKVPFVNPIGKAAFDLNPTTRNWKNYISDTNNTKKSIAQNILNDQSYALDVLNKKKPSFKSWFTPIGEKKYISPYTSILNNNSQDSD